MFKLHCFLFITSVVVKVFSVPPAVCRAEFRWDDCGKPPKPVMYYWKSGSRCEIGYWRGCLPNPNMFADEYECINTCVFVDRPTAWTEPEETEPELTTDHENSTISDDNTDDGTTSPSGHDPQSTASAVNVTDAASGAPDKDETTDAHPTNGTSTEGSGTEVTAASTAASNETTDATEPDSTPKPE